MRNGFISKRAEVGRGVILGNNVTLYGNCQIGDSSIVGDNVTIGFPMVAEPVGKRRMSTIDALSTHATRIGNRAKILSNSVVYSGVQIGADTTVFEHSRIGPGTRIGLNCRVCYGAQIYSDVSIGDRSTVAGFCCNRSMVGNGSTMMGALLHRYDRGWVEGYKEPSPRVEDSVIVGYDALVIGNVRISRNVYIGAGAIVTRDIPSNSVVIGDCRIYSDRNWKGKLKLHRLFPQADSRGLKR